MPRKQQHCLQNIERKMIKKYSSQPSAYRRDSQQELKNQHIFILHRTIIVTQKTAQKTYAGKIYSNSQQAETELWHLLIKRPFKAKQKFT